MDLAGIRLRGVCKVWHYDCTGISLSKGDIVVVSTERGVSLGVVTDLVPSWDPPEESPPREFPKVVRLATPEDVATDRENDARERAARDTCLRRIVARGLPMKLIRVEILLDRSKTIFYFTADGRIDFRELVKDLARELHTRIEMRQIGVRDEARVVGGMGPCGKELCCATFLSDFAPITVKMAKDQRLSLNPAKLSGVCGRLMCCLIYEHHSYARVKGAPPPEGAPVHPCDTCPAADAAPPGEPAPPPRAEAAPEREQEQDPSAAPALPGRPDGEPPKVAPAAAPRDGDEEVEDGEPPEDGGEDEGGDDEEAAGTPDGSVPEGGAPPRRRRSRRRRGRGGKGGGGPKGTPPGGPPPAKD